MRALAFLWALLVRAPMRFLGRTLVVLAGLSLVFVWGFVPVAVLLGFVLGTGLWLRIRRHRKWATLHGSARFATRRDLDGHGLRGRRGLILGRVGRAFLRFDRPGHLLTFAPTRSGKGAGSIIPNLLDHPGSVFVIDPKGENHAASSAFRESIGRVHAIAPFDRQVEASRFNPIDFIRVGEAEQIDDATLITDMLVVSSGPETFWDSEAKALITCLLLYVAHACTGPERTLSHVWTLLMRDQDGFDDLLEEVLAIDHAGIAAMARGFSQKEIRERSAVISTAQTHMKIWKSPLLARATEASDFMMEDLKRRPTSLYLILPPELLETYRPFVRLFVGLALVATTRARTARREPVVFFLDETAALGRMEPIEAGIGWLAGYGTSLWLFFQDLDQLMQIYPRWRSMIANCAVRQAFNVTDYATAAELSNMLGTRTVIAPSISRATAGPLSLLPNHFSTSEGLQARKLMTPDEVMAMPTTQQLLFVQACPPIRARKIRWFAEEPFRARKALAERRTIARKDES